VRHPLWREDAFVICRGHTQQHMTSIHFRVRVTLRLAVYRQSLRPLRTRTRTFYFPTEHLRLQSLCKILSDERMSLSFTIATGPRQRSYSQIRVPGDSWPHFTVSQTYRAKSPYLYSPETWWPSYNPKHWVPFSSAPTNRRATVEVFDLTSTRDIYVFT
jgi:hypothetical protein